MKRELMSALIGVSFLVPSQVDAQRARHGAQVGHPAPVTVSGRVASCRRPADARPFDCRARVVYTSGPRYATRRSDWTWIRAEWRPIRYAPVRWTHVDRRFLDQGELRALLGHRTVDMIRDEGRHAGLRGPLRGEWFDVRGQGRTLVVRMDGYDVAELVDFDRDGVIDDVFLMRHRVAPRTVGLR